MLTLIGVVLALGGCRESAEPTPTPTVAPTPTATAAATRTPAPTATKPPPTPTPTATPLPQPAVVVADQPLTAAGTIAVAAVTLPRDGWLGLAAADGTLLASMPLAAGTTTDLTLQIDPLAATATLRALLAEDETFAEGAVLVSAEFTVTPDLTYPALTVGDQDVGDDGVVTIDSVLALSDGWVVLYADADGAPGPRLGQAYVRAGRQADVPVTIPWRQATPVLHAVLHADQGRAERLDAADIADSDGSDPAVMVRQAPVQVTFRAVYPPEVLIFDQAVVGNSVQVERVVSYGPGWIAVVFQTTDEQPGNIVGFAPLADGVNERVTVPVDPQFITATMYVALYRDTRDIGEFEFPNADPIIQLGGVPRYIPFRTDAGNYLVARDQARGADGTVTVDYTISNIPMWVVARDDDGGQPGAVRGFTWVPAGINRDVRVALTDDAPAELLIVLHVDNGAAQTFEFDAGLDFELQRNRNIIAVPIRLDSAEP